MRVRDGIAGFTEGWRRDRSLRTHFVLAVAGMAVLLLVSVELPWLLAYIVLAVLGSSAELFNGALEAALDRLHPHHNVEIGAAKDLGSAAALVINVAAALVFVAAILF